MTPDDFLHGGLVEDEDGAPYPEHVQAVVQTLAQEVDRLRVEARTEATFIRNLTGDDGEPALLESGYPELTAALDRMEAAWR